MPQRYGSGSFSLVEARDMDPMTLWYAIGLRWNTGRFMRHYAVRRWWLSESELRLMDGNR